MPNIREGSVSRELLDQIAGPMEISMSSHDHGRFIYPDPTFRPGVDFASIQLDRTEINKLIKEEKKMKNSQVFEVLVVCRKKKEILLDTRVIADSREGALFKSGVAGVLEKAGIDYDEAHVFVQSVTTFTVIEKG